MAPSPIRPSTSGIFFESPIVQTIRVNPNLHLAPLSGIGPLRTRNHEPRLLSTVSAPTLSLPFFLSYNARPFRSNLKNRPSESHFACIFSDERFRTCFRDPRRPLISFSFFPRNLDSCFLPVPTPSCPLSLQ